MAPKRILAYTDLSEASDRALELARRLSETYDARVHVLRVVPDPLSAPWTAEVRASSLPEVQDAMVAETREHLDRVIDDPFGRFDAALDIETGDPEEEILRYAARHAIDLIVMGVDRTKDGGDDQEEIAEGLVRRSRCSVLVARETGATVPADEMAAGEDEDFPNGAA